MDLLHPKLLKRRRTKIVATLGPASRDPAIIDQLIAAGVNVFRLNMSHGEHADHRLACAHVRAAALRRGEPVAVLADLCGPKIRVGRFRDGQISLAAGERVTVTTRDVPGEPGLIPSQYEPLARDAVPGNRILLDDGLLELRVETVAGTELTCVVVHGGVLKDRKGMNLPGVQVSAPALTEKDRRDVALALELDVDFLALSFVRRAGEVEELKALVAAAGKGAHVVAKIEKPEALESIDAILDAADGIMVARGDLGVELPPEHVPLAQHALVARAKQRNKPVIVATQMLESMIAHPRPTRAEVSDVAHAVLMGADAVMLSAETASGAYPVQAVMMMDSVARRGEAALWSESAFGGLAETAGEPPLPLHVAVARATAQLARDLRVRTIVAVSSSGASAMIMSSARPAAPVVAIGADAGTTRRMNLLWGVVPRLVGEAELVEPRALARSLVRDLGLAEPGQHVLLVSGFGTATTENAPTVTALEV